MCLLKGLFRRQDNIIDEGLELPEFSDLSV